MKRVLSAALAVTAAAANAAEPAPVAAPANAPLPAIAAPVRPPVDNFARFEAEVAGLVQRDAMAATADDAILFVGSSSIRMWDVAHAFPARAAINRGFGGATTREVLHFYEKVIGGYKPTSVVVYVGENDITEGIEPDRVAADVLALLGRLRSDMPGARIVYLSMKPTPSRWDLFPKMAAVNAAVKARSSPAPGGGFDFLDVGSVLLTPAGLPDARYFGPDGLHMNARGYALWAERLNGYLAPAAKPASTVVAGVAGGL